MGDPSYDPDKFSAQGNPIDAAAKAELVASTASLAKADDAFEAAARNPAFLALLKPVYAFAKNIAPIGVGMIGGPAAAAVVAAGIQILDKVDGPNL